MEADAVLGGAEHNPNDLLGMVFKTPCSPLWFEGVRSGTISTWKNKLNWD